MKIQLRRLLWIVPAALILMGAHHANAQDLSRMNTRDMLLKIKTLNVDQMSQIVRNMDRDTMTQIIRSMDSQAMSQIVRSLDPNTMSEIAKRILVEFASARPKSVAVTSRVPETNQPPLGTTRVEFAAVSEEGREQQNSAPNFQAPEDVREEQMDLTGLVVIAHPSNPVNELTMDQIRKIYTGEFTNWNQVGGLDIDVKVMTVCESSGGQAKLTSNGTVSAFASCVFLGVAGNTGALGFVPKLHSRQLRFLGSHQAIKTMAVNIEVPAQGAKEARSGSATGMAEILLAFSR